MATALRLTAREIRILQELREAEASTRDESEWDADPDAWRYVPSDEDAQWVAENMNTIETPDELEASLKALGHQLDALTERLDAIPPIRSHVGDEDVRIATGCVG